MSKGEVSELLKPRKKCVANDTSGDFDKGDILTLPPDNQDRYWWNERTQRTIVDPSAYPHLFVDMAWYEEREASEIEAITFVKILPDDIVERSGRYGKVEKWVTEKFHAVPEPQTLAYIIDYKPGYEIEGEQFGRLNIAHLEPCSETEYNQYISKTQTQEQ